MILFTYIKPLFRGQTGVNYGVTVVFPGEIVQGGLERRRRLTECIVAYGVHFDLQSGAVGAFAELRHLLVRVVENAPVIALILVRLKQSRVHGAEAAVKRRCKAAPYAGQAALLHLWNIHGLEENPKLHAVFEAAPHPALHIHVHILGEAHSAHGVNHSYALGSHIVRRTLHIFNQLYRRNRVRNIVGNGKERLLIHFSGVRMVAPQMRNLIL